MPNSLYLVSIKGVVDTCVGQDLDGSRVERSLVFAHGPIGGL
jgi:hypothetical protein